MIPVVFTREGFVFTSEREREVLVLSSFKAEEVPVCVHAPLLSCTAPPLSDSRDESCTCSNRQPRVASAFCHRLFSHGVLLCCVVEEYRTRNVYVSRVCLRHCKETCGSAAADFRSDSLSPTATAVCMQGNDG